MSGRCVYINRKFRLLLDNWEFSTRAPRVASRSVSLVFMGFLVVKIESEVHA